MAAEAVWADEAEALSALVRIGAFRVRVAWQDRRDVIAVSNKVAGLNTGLAWVATRAAEQGRPLKARIIWADDARLAEVAPDGRYHWLDVGVSGL